MTFKVRIKAKNPEILNFCDITIQKIYLIFDVSLYHSLITNSVNNLKLVMLPLLTLLRSY